MALQEIRTFKDIQDAILRRGKLKDQSKTRDDIKEKINTYYQRIAFKKHYRWSGETRPLILPEKYNTGTIDATNGSNIISGTDTVWTAFDHRYKKMKIEGRPNPFKIIRVAGNTELTLDAPYVGDDDTGLTYEIYQDEFGLFPDLLNIRKIYIPSHRRWLIPTGPSDLDRKRYASPFRSSLPEVYTINGLMHYKSKTWEDFLINTDFWEDDPDGKPKNKRLIIWPAIMSEDTIVQMRYSKLMEPMGSDNDEPLVPYEVRSILVYGPLMEWFLQNRDIQTRGEWEKEYRILQSNMEADVESTDDELILQIDRRKNRPRSSYLYQDDDAFKD